MIMNFAYMCFNATHEIVREMFCAISCIEKNYFIGGTL